MSREIPCAFIAASQRIHVIHIAIHVTSCAEVATLINLSCKMSMSTGKPTLWDSPVKHLGGTLVDLQKRQAPDEQRDSDSNPRNTVPICLLDKAGRKSVEGDSMQRA